MLKFTLVRALHFSFWNSNFYILEIFMFLYYANEERDDIINSSEYLPKDWSSHLQTWHLKFISQKKQNDTYNIVALATLLAPVSFCYKPNITEPVNRLPTLLWCIVLVPSLKNTALIFLKIFVIECCTVSVEPPITSSLSSFA